MSQKIISVLVVLVTLFSCTAEKQNVKKKIDSHLDLGISSLNEANYTEALRQFLEAEKLSPDNPQIQNYLGLAFMLKQDLEGAREHFQKAVSLNSQYSEAYNNLGVIYLDMKKWDEAIPCFEKALSDILYSTPETAWVNLGDAFMGKKNYSKSIECYKKSIDLAASNPRVCVVHRKLGRACYLSGKFLEAVGALEKAKKLCPSDCETPLFLGEADVRMGQKKKAVGEFREVLRLCPSGDLAETARGYLRLMQ